MVQAKIQEKVYSDLESFSAGMASEFTKITSMIWNNYAYLESVEKVKKSSHK